MGNKTKYKKIAKHKLRILRQTIREVSEYNFKQFELPTITKLIPMNITYHLVLDFHISTGALRDLNNNEQLTDEHINRASLLLKTKFTEIESLNLPLGVTYGNAIVDINFYPRFERRNSFVQIVHTGHSDHWFNIILQKESSTVLIMDSWKKADLSGHVQIQVAMILRSIDKHVILRRPPCKQQRNGVDCSLIAIAHAKEFCSNGKINRYDDFDLDQLRSHWKKCLLSNDITPFPKLSHRRKKIREDFEYTLKLYCTCRLHAFYDNQIQCDEREEWFHKKCVVFESHGENIWQCDGCKANKST